MPVLAPAGTWPAQYAGDYLFSDYNKLVLDKCLYHTCYNNKLLYHKRNFN